jgi:hypothetical protein
MVGPPPPIHVLYGDFYSTPCDCPLVIIYSYMAQEVRFMYSFVWKSATILEAKIIVP